ncbi:MAG: phosphoribosylanthranilate isomerase [Candidatus Omnitrophota bacterium]
MVKVKICGITNKEDALLCVKEGADALGFIFTKKSPRYITHLEAKKIIAELDPFTVKVGVFLDEVKERVFEIAEELSLDVLQFHGKESAAYCNFFKHKYKVIKVFFPQGSPLREAIASYKIDAFLFDVKPENKLKGQSTLPGDLLREIAALIKEGNRIIISGGLTVKNISRIRKLHPYAVDIASGVEKFVGKKDEQLVKMFIEKAKGIG